MKHFEFITWLEEGKCMLIGVVCVSMMGNLLAIFLSIVMWQESYGFSSLSCLPLFGCFPRRWRSFCIDGEDLVRRRKAWDLVTLALMWIVWGERNRQTFDGMKDSILLLKSRLIFLFFVFLVQLVFRDG